ncbi:unnamed protein product [Rangifer tarandus platyrhynchus]|uniref:Uncharacterized protein n=2 Tax=Rangifer tarandus platyrhynchus TaxID=3082113 RepID=A0ABN8Z5S8_RANTA|nr:unnamed protein product [Rangifer tarandus platyrhynchus]
MLICRYLKAFSISKVEHYDLLHAIHNCGSEFWKNKEEIKKENHTEFCQKYSLVLILPDMFTFIYSLNIFSLSLCATHHSRLCCCSVSQSCPALCNHMDCSTPGLPPLTISRSLPKFMSTESGKPSSHLILCRPLLLPPSIFPSISVFFQ